MLNRRQWVGSVFRRRTGFRGRGIRNGTERYFLLKKTLALVAHHGEHAKGGGEGEDEPEPFQDIALIGSVAQGG
jgi:hypothetical protein